MLDNKVTANIYVIAAPSGGGKSSIIKQLLINTSAIEVTISHTTRPIRNGEEHGNDYYFVSEQEFEQLSSQDGFVETAKVYNYRYGTSREEVNRIIDAGNDVILDIDWQGFMQVKQNVGVCTGIFILPPSKEIILHRLLERKRDSTQVIDQRMRELSDQVAHFNIFDYLVINDQFEQAVDDVQKIILAQRLALPRHAQKNHYLLQSFLADS